MAILFALAAIKLSMSFWTNAQFEFHRDELLYIAMGHRLGWGYLEVPPAIAGIAGLAQSLLGNSIFAFRFFPALVGASMVVLIGLITRELGGRRFAQALAAVAFIVSPAYLRSTMLFLPVVFDQFFFVLGAYLVVKLVQKDDPKHWLLLGLVCGLGMLNKYSMLLFGFGLFVGLLLTPKRKLLASRWPWLAVGLSIFVALPNLLWQHSHQWPIVEHMRVLSRNQLSHVEPLGFGLMQILMTFAATPVWLAGLAFLFAAKAGKPYRVLGWMYVAILLVLLLFSGKAYYLLPAYPMLLAAGAVAIEKYARDKRLVWLQPAVIGLVIFGNLVPIPYGIPFLSVGSFEKYAKFMAEYMGLVEPLRWETGELHSIPQDYADMLGWENQVATVARVYHALVPEEQQKCVILASNYGEAGAIDFYRKAYGLPAAHSYNGSYYVWGPGDLPGEVLITVGLDQDTLQPYFETVELADTITHAYARENGVPVLLCRTAKISLQDMWPRLARYRY